ncbi:MAG: FAD-dependent oxidoreductase [Desulfosarcinaceae bacterium]|nr:FAD-dependent oxidoreductase [Desulfosarcinaceae bacterium]
MAYPHLMTPITLGAMTAPNRLMMPAMSINFGVDDRGYVTDQLTAYFLDRARGGTGLLLVGGGAVHPSGLELPHLPILWEDGCIPALEAMTRAVKAHEGRFGMQLMHGGRQSYHDQKVAPSAIPAPAVVKGIPRALSGDDIAELVAAFGDAARRCRDAGFDFIEVHAAHGYLINQFLSPNANLREDAYGGSFANRIRFLMELIADIRQKTGDDFPLGIRINGEDYLDGGWTLDDARRLAPLLERAGVDYLHISAGVYGSSQLTIPSMYVPEGCFIHLAAEVKRVVDLPIVAVGRIKTLEMAETVVAEGQADIVAMGRAHLADPHLAHKANHEGGSNLRPCMGCCVGCIHAVLALEPGGCVVNPDVGREHLLHSPATAAGAPSTKQILVIGAGPAGMAAARMAALNGHKVRLVEQSDHTGGIARLAAQAPGRREVGEVMTYFRDEIERLGIPVALNSDGIERILEADRFDAVVVATGSLPEVPLIKGIAQTRMQLLSVLDVLAGETVDGECILVLGGNQGALTTTDFLAEAGKSVTILNRQQHYAEEMSSNDRYYLRERLKRDSVSLFKAVTVKRILPDGARVVIAGETKDLVGFDALVVAEGMTPIRDTLAAIRKRGLPFTLIGDAKEARTLMHAIAEGEEIGRAI